MNILVLNPNTTAAMTQRVVSNLQRAMPHAQLLPLTAASGDAVIATQDAFDAAAAAAPRMLRGALDRGLSFDAVLLACFGDPGLEEMRAMAGVPVTGLAWASMQEAEHGGQPYAIVTTGQPWQDILTQRLRQWGAGPLFKGVHVAAATGLSVLQDPEGAMPAVTRAIQQARDAGALSVILGGAVFAGYRELMSAHGLHVGHLVDCVQASALQLRSRFS